MVDILCPCPPLAGGEVRHPAGDTVNLRERFGFVEAASVRNAVAMRRVGVDGELEAAEVLAVLTEGYIIHGVIGWSLEDDEGSIPVTRANVRTYILDRWDIASVVADAADDQYSEAVMLPLLAQASTSSRPLPTEDSTSPNPVSGTQAPTQSKRSSISTIPTEDTEATTKSPGGGSKSSRSSTTAA